MGTSRATSSTRQKCCENQLFNTPSSCLHHPTHYLLSSFQNSIPSWFASLHFFPAIVLCKVEPCKKHLKLTSQLLSFPRECECFPLGFWHLRHTHLSQCLIGRTKVTKCYVSCFIGLSFILKTKN